MILATLCYIKQDGRTLMIHRTKRPDDIHAGKWNGLGGKMEAGENTRGSRSLLNLFEELFQGR